MARDYMATAVMKIRKLFVSPWQSLINTHPAILHSGPTDIFVAFLLAAIFACCMYLRHKICPDDEILFSDIQLEEIRLERVSAKEKTLLGRMSQMKVWSSLLIMIVWS
jgi:hypothetical protein